MLRTLLIPVAAAGAIVAFSGIAYAETRAVDLPAFTAASFDSAVTASIVVGGPQSVSVEAATAGDLDGVRMEVVDGQLRVWRDRGILDFLSFHDPRITVTITVPSLTALQAGASSIVGVDGMTADSLSIETSSAAEVGLRNVAARAIHIEASSSSELTIEGTCETAEVETSSSARIEAGALKCVDVRIAASSSSETLMFASGAVTADASSAAIVRLAGNPARVRNHVNSSADVEIID